jgi:hypothetical protein
MLRITVEAREGDERVLQLDGSIAGLWVAELRRLCEQSFTGTGALMLDCANVLFIDNQGVLLIQSLIERGASFVNCSPFLTERLRLST